MWTRSRPSFSAADRSGHKRASVLRTSIIRLTACIGLAVAASVGGDIPRPVDAAARPRFKAVAFDFLVLFDPNSVVSEVEQSFPGKGLAFTQLWRTRQFEYAWLRSITDRYVDFFTVTEDALVYASNAMKLELTAERKQRLMNAYLRLTPWPDAADTLRQLRASGVRVIALANFSPDMLQANTANAGLAGLFDALVSTDANRTYKPDPRSYRLGIEQLQLAREDVLFAAFGGWDAAGAKAFGYPTVWVNRLNQPVEELGVRPDEIVTDLKGLLEFVLSEARAR